MAAISNSEIKHIRSLSTKKFRDTLGLFVVEGEKLVSEALSSGLEVVSVYRRDEIGAEAMSRISQFDSPSPVLAVVRKPEPEKAVPFPGLCLALDSVRDPGNLGTIIRIADWFGVSAIYASPDSVELYNPKVIQSTMGAIFRKKVIYTDIPSICKAFAAEGRRVCGTFLDGTDIYGSELAGDSLVVMGNESNGISPEVGSLVSQRLLIPSFAQGPAAESLNVAVATAITVSEFKRRTL